MHTSCMSVISGSSTETTDGEILYIYSFFDSNMASKAILECLI